FKRAWYRVSRSNWHINWCFKWSIVGMLLLFLLLQFKVLDLSSIENVSGFFLDNMAIFFIPAGVSLIKSLDLIRENVLVLLLVICLSTLIVMYTTGIIVEKMIKKKEEGQKNV
ncbi:CidA/LrgA family protein, partial [Clostridioides difficile]|uniref:CidA/LrgA family protein n=1 Tax=Clostridioides difficile TaxID=1496 RepID=UPI0029C4BF65